jgi:hypothetical protein
MIHRSGQSGAEGQENQGTQVRRVSMHRSDASESQSRIMIYAARRVRIHGSEKSEYTGMEGKNMQVKTVRINRLGYFRI